MAFDAGRIWWREAKIIFDPDFVAEIDADLATIDPSIDLALMNRKMLEEIHQIEKDAAKSSEAKELSPPIEHDLLRHSPLVSHSSLAEGFVEGFRWFWFAPPQSVQLLSSDPST